MNHQLSRCFLLFLICFCPYCGFSTEESIFSRSVDSIKNGRVIDIPEILILIGDEDPIKMSPDLEKIQKKYNPVGVVLSQYRSRLAWGIGNCTGALIGPKTVLTAAHCIRPGKDYYFQLDRRDSVKVRKAIAHPQWYIDGHPYDIGLLLLEEKIGDLQPFKISKEFQDSGDALRLVGYGAYQDTDKQGNLIDSGANGTKRIGYNVATDRKVRDGKVIVYEGAPGCKGDSGGPLFIEDPQGMEILIGVHSAGGCGTEGWATSVPHFLDWIFQNSEGDIPRSQVKENPFPAPSEEKIQCLLCPGGLRYRSTMRMIETSMGRLSCEEVVNQLRIDRVAPDVCREMLKASARCCVPSIKKNRCRIGSKRGGASRSSECQ